MTHIQTWSRHYLHTTTDQVWWRSDEISGQTDKRDSYIAPITNCNRGINIKLLCSILKKLWPYKFSARWTDWLTDGQFNCYMPPYQGHKHIPQFNNSFSIIMLWTLALIWATVLPVSIFRDPIIFEPDGIFFSLNSSLKKFMKHMFSSLAHFRFIPFLVPVPKTRIDIKNKIAMSIMSVFFSVLGKRGRVPWEGDNSRVKGEISMLSK